MKQTQKGVLIILIAIAAKYSYSQQINQDMISIGSSYTLKGDSEVDVNTFNFETTFINKRLKNRKGVLRLGVNYDFTNIGYDNKNLFTSDLEQFHNIGVSLFYLRVLNQKWSFGTIVQPQLSSNFTSSLSYDDFNPNVAVFFNYSSIPRENRLSFGLAYAPNSGIGFPVLPLIYYWQQIDHNIEMNLGFPETSITYEASSKTALKASVKFDGFNYNLSKNLRVNNALSQRVNYNEIIAGFGIRQKITDRINLNFNAGYSLTRTFEFTDNSGDRTLGLDTQNNLNLSIGLGFNPFKKKKKN